MDKTISINGEYYRLDRKMSEIIDEGVPGQKFITLVFTRTDAHKMSGNNTFAFTLGFDTGYDELSRVPSSTVTFHGGVLHHGYLESKPDDPSSHMLNISEGYVTQLATGAAPIEVQMMALDIIKKKFTI